MANTADQVEVVEPVYLFIYCSLLSSRSVCLCSVPVGSTVCAWLRSSGMTSFILITRDVAFSSSELGQCTYLVPEQNQEKLTLLDHNRFSGPHGIRGKSCQMGGKGFSEITTTTGPACILSSPEWARLIKNSLQINLRGGSPWFSGTKHNNTRKQHSCGTLIL